MPIVKGPPRGKGARRNGRSPHPTKKKKKSLQQKCTLRRHHRKHHSQGKPNNHRSIAIGLHIRTKVPGRGIGSKTNVAIIVGRRGIWPDHVPKASMSGGLVGSVVAWIIRSESALAGLRKGWTLHLLLLVVLLLILRFVLCRVGVGRRLVPLRRQWEGAPAPSHERNRGAKPLIWGLGVLAVNPPAMCYLV